MIRLATEKDVPAMLDIYAPYIRTTAITFEYEVPGLAEFRARFLGIAEKYPWYVWEEQGRILGYAYADKAFSRAAYQWDVDLSIYLDMEARGRGLGAKLYNCLEAQMRLLGYHNLYAIITGANAGSRRFHERRGYELLGVLKQTGFKQGAWHDVYWYGLRIAAAEAPLHAPDRFTINEAAEALMRTCSQEKRS